MVNNFTNINRVNNYGGLENVVRKNSVYLICIKVYIVSHAGALTVSSTLNIHI